MKKIVFIIIFVLNVAIADEVFITIGSDAVTTSLKSIPAAKSIQTNGEISIVRVDDSQIESLSQLMHHKFNRCGGFIVHDSFEEAQAVLNDSLSRKIAKNIPFINYTIDQSEKVNNFISQVDEFKIRSTILHLSSYHNRYYKSQTGIDSQAWIKTQWEQLAKGRSDVKVEYVKHSQWPQPSVVMTVEGTSKADEIVVIGGHADSIAGAFLRSRAHAPGADDNASGIATITETIRIMMSNSYRPQRTVKFMAYAAEEVGLLGSKEIAANHKSAQAKVVGVMQLDMTNHKGSNEFDIVFMNDFTNAQQNNFLGKLIDEYLGYPWGFSRCGYGCSDHASWHNQGFPASIPFESTMRDINSKIHTKHDTIDVSGGNADHATKFAQLAVAFLAEMGK